MKSKAAQIKANIFPRAIPMKIGFWNTSYARLYRNKIACISLAVIALLLFCAIIVPYLSSHTYYETHLSLKNTAPCKRFWFGTDELGRDLFVRIWWGARISLFVGITAALIDMVIGVLFGAFSGLMGGKVDEFMMRLCDILYSLPYLLVVILLMVIFKPGLATIIIALTITGWINMARIVRGQILLIKEYDFILASQMLGASRLRILGRHLIPNCFGQIITTMTLTIPTAIFSEAFLSFLGLGVQAPFASWGTMASDGLSAMRYYPWRLFFPSIFICITMLALNIIGDGIRDAFDPRIEH